MIRGAKFSPCGNYRLELFRQWDAAKPFVSWIMLNPSTADGDEDDATIRRCISFSQTFGFGGMYVYNLFAYIATDPNDLVLAWQDGVDISGDEDGAMATLLSGVSRSAGVIAAWGARGGVVPGRAEYVQSRLPIAYCLGKTKLGQPRHPLYLKSDVMLEPF